MYKKHLNPTVDLLTKTCRKRAQTLWDHQGPIDPAVPAVGNGKLCFWDLVPLTGRKYKWCSPECGDAAYAWCNPQSEYGLAFLLARQGYKCACGYDWNPLADSLLGKFGVPKALDRLTQSNVKFVKMIKNRSPKGTKPEVDHITPISKGGTAIGFDNHQALCFTCHKAKSKIDNSGPRKKKT